MIRTHEEVKTEALERLKLLKLMPDVKKAFKTNETVYYSERLNAQFPAVLYWLSNKPEYMKLKEDFEKKYDCMVYHAILTHFEFGWCLDWLYVSNDDTNWESDKDDIADRYVFVYSNNLDDPNCDDFGTIAVSPAMGGLKRVS